MLKNDLCFKKSSNRFDQKLKYRTCNKPHNSFLYYLFLNSLFIEKYIKELISYTVSFLPGYCADSLLLDWEPMRAKPHADWPETLCLQHRRKWFEQRSYVPLSTLLWKLKDFYSYIFQRRIRINSVIKASGGVSPRSYCFCRFYYCFRQVKKICKIFKNLPLKRIEFANPAF